MPRSFSLPSRCRGRAPVGLAWIACLGLVGATAVLAGPARALASSGLARQDLESEARRAKEMLSRIQRQGDKVAPRVIENLASMRTSAALEAMRECENCLSEDLKVIAWVRAFRHFAAGVADEAPTRGRGRGGVEEGVGVGRVLGPPDEVSAGAIAYLGELAGHKDDRRRREAVLCLAHFGAEAAPELERLVERSRHDEVKRLAIGPLIEFYAEHPDADGLANILACYRFPESSTRTRLVTNLQAFRDPVSMSLFAKTLGRARYPLDHRLAIVEALGGIVAETVGLPRRPIEAGAHGSEAGGSEVDRAGSGGLGESDPGAEPTADDAHPLAGAVARRGRVDDELVRTLRAGLRAKDPLVQLASLQVLERSGTRDHLRELEDLEATRDESLRRAVFDALTRHLRDDPDWLAKMLRYASSPDLARRHAAIRPLARLGGPEAAAQLVSMIADPEAGVRREVYGALGDLRPREAVGPLVERMALEEGQARSALRRCLRRLTGQDHGLSAERWAAWWRAVEPNFELPSLERIREYERELERRASAQLTEASFYGIEIEGDRLAFVLDISGSMDIETSRGDSRLDELKQQVVAALEGVADGDLFNLIFFAGEVYPWRDMLVPMDRRERKEAVHFVEDLETAGATALFDALETAVADPRTETIYLLSDGEASAGRVQDPRRLRAAVGEWLARRPLVIHTISIGADNELLRSLAEDSGGSYRHVE